MQEFPNKPMEKSIPLSNVIFMVLCALLIGLGIGSRFTELRSKINVGGLILGKEDLRKQNFDLFWEVYETVKNNYVDEEVIDTQKMYYGAIRGMVDSLGDSATMFFDPAQTSDYNDSQSGKYFGIGAELDYSGGLIYVIATFDGSPAQKSGLRSGDIISEVDGESVIDKTLTEIVKMIRGDAGTKVKLTIVRKGKEREIEITRGEIEAPSMSIKEVKNGIVNVRLNRFTEATLSDWIKKWNEISNEVEAKYKKGEVRGMIIDLRSNPGGFFDAAVYLSGSFVDRGTVISYQRERNGKDESYSTDTTPKLKDIPLVVLVDKWSASASEIFSGAMQHYKRAYVIGEKTYGKGTAQMVIPYKNGSSLHLTVSKWLLPNKQWINRKNPIVPDKEVKFDTDLKEREGRDNQLEEAYKYFN